MAGRDFYSQFLSICTNHTLDDILVNYDVPFESVLLSRPSTSSLILTGNRHFFKNELKGRRRGNGDESAN